MKYNPFFWPSLIGGIFDDDFFAKDGLLASSSEKQVNDEDAYVFNFLNGIDVDVDAVNVSVKDNLLTVKYDKKDENEVFHFSSSRTIPEDANLETIEAFSDGNGFTVRVAKLKLPGKEPEPVRNIPVQKA